MTEVLLEVDGVSLTRDINMKTISQWNNYLSKTRLYNLFYPVIKIHTDTHTRRQAYLVRKFPR